MNPILKKALPHVAAIATFFILCLIFFRPQLDNKVLRQGDVLQYIQKNKESKDFQEEHGEPTAWTNAQFGGMPTYQMSYPPNSNLIRFFDYYVLRLGYKVPIGPFFASMVCFYIMMLCFGTNPWIALIASVAYGFTTNNIHLAVAGHNNKLVVLASAPLIVGSLYSLFNRKYLIGAALFAIAMGLNITGNHIQMTYYLFLALIFFGVVKLVQAIREKQLRGFALATGLAVLGGGLAVGSTAITMLSSWEYQKDTMRGDPILERPPAQEAASSSETKGLEWGYAMMWSNGFLDLVSSLIPGVVGGSTQEMVAEDGPVMQDLKRKGARLGKNFKAPLYWGPMPFTGGPPYYGAVVWLLFAMAFFLVDKKMRIWVGLGFLAILIFSMGKFFPLNRLLFDHLPLFNKFRAPNSAMGLGTLFICLLGFYAVSGIFTGKYSYAQIIRALKFGGGALAAVLAFFWLFGSGMMSFAGADDARYVNAGWSLDALMDERKALMRSDALRTLLFVLAGAGVIWAMAKNAFNRYALVGALGLLTLVDLAVVNSRYIGPQSYEVKKDFEGRFRPNAADQQILSQEKSRGDYRVLDLAINTFNSARPSYFHSSIGGNHAAKLQRYQDLIDRHIGRGNNQVLGMLNTKYVISKEGQLQQNPAAIGPVWFVESVRTVATPNEEIDALNSFDYTKEAIVLAEEFSGYLDGLSLQKQGTITLTEYLPNHLIYQSNSSSEQLAVFSEIWYGPNKGWQVYIDGDAVDHIRANYALRALRVPAGEHKIEFVFDPQILKTGNSISIVCSSLLLLSLLVFVFTGGRALMREQAAIAGKAEIPQPVAQPDSQTKKPKGRRKRK